MNRKFFNFVIGSLLPALMFFAVSARGEPSADAVWIDVRTPSEFAQGHLPQAVNIPFDGIEVGVAKLQLPRDAEIYLYCGSGHRAGIAQTRLQQQGYTRATNAGGLQHARALADQSGP